MGICESKPRSKYYLFDCNKLKFNKKLENKNETIKGKDLEDRQSLNKQDFSNKNRINKVISEIKNEKKTSIKRNINDENLSDCLDIIDCVDSTIIIFHPLLKVNIIKCINCSIFIAPCKGRYCNIHILKIQLSKKI